MSHVEKLKQNEAAVKTDEKSTHRSPIVFINKQRVNASGKPINKEGKYVTYETAENNGWDKGLLSPPPVFMQSYNDLKTNRSIKGAQRYRKNGKWIVGEQRVNAKGKPIDSHGKFMKYSEAEKKGWDKNLLSPTPSVLEDFVSMKKALADLGRNCLNRSLSDVTDKTDARKERDKLIKTPLEEFLVKKKKTEEEKLNGPNGDVPNIEEERRKGMVALKSIYSKYGRDNPLFSACGAGKDHEVSILLKYEKSIEVNATGGQYDCTPLLWALEKGHQNIAKLLIADLRVDINKAANTGVTPLWKATQQNYAEIVQLLVQDRRMSSINEASRHDNWTPIYIAVRFKFVTIVKTLLKTNGIDVNVASTPALETPLLTATFLGYTNIVKMLVNSQKDNIDVNKTNRSGEAPLYWATRKGFYEIVKILLGHDRIDVNHGDNKYNYTALHDASCRGDFNIVKALLSHKDIDIGKTNTYNGRDALWMANQRRHYQIASLIEEKKSASRANAINSYNPSRSSFNAHRNGAPFGNASRYQGYPRRDGWGAVQQHGFFS